MIFANKIRFFFLILAVQLVCLFGFAGQAAAALPANFQDEPVLTGLNQPANLAVLPDGRMLVLLKGGEIRLFDPAISPASSTSFMTIIDIESGQERGLASIALDPNFATNKYFYVYYTHGSTARNRISRFTSNGNTADLASELMIWQDNENWSDCCHYGGGLSFGPDGKLYLTTGEEFDGAQAQDLTRAGGKIIRVNSDGSIPIDNPFYDGPGGNLDEIWAFGLRNPYRAKWDLVGNRFFIGDVGGNVQATAREEINIGQAGRNYGWPFYEGVSNDPAYKDPVYDYQHVPGEIIGGFQYGGAVTAGFVYRGNMFPSQYYGKYFLADYVNDWIRYLEFDANNQVIATTEWTATVNSIVAMVEGPEGAIYYADIETGQVRRIVYFSGNQPPTISSVSVTPSQGPAPLDVTLSVTATDPEGDPMTYHWIFGDGTEADGGATISHTYAEGVYTAYAQVSDLGKTSLSEPTVIQSGNPPVVTIDTPVFGSLFQALDFINYSGTAVDPDETLLDSSYSWTVRFLHNAHTHPVLNDAIGSSGSFQVNDSGHDYFDNTGFELILTVTDSAGLTGTDRVEIYPDKVNLNFSTSPAGQNIFLDGLQQTTPLVYDTMIGFRHTISASSYCDIANDTGYTFSSWSDGGAQTHEVTVPSVDLNLVANFVVTGSCVNVVTSGLALHLESDQGLLVSGTDVTGWVDQSIAGNDLVSAGNPQLVIAPDLKGTPVVDFDGIGDKLERTLTLNGLPTGNTDRTIFLVAKYRGTGFGGFAYGSPNCNEAFGAIVDNVGNLTAQGWCPSNDFPSTTVGTGAGWAVQSVVLKAGVMTHYKDGVLIDTQSHTYNTTLTKMVLGGELADNKFMDMQVAAVLVYDRALTVEEQQITQAYLSKKYFDTSSLALATTSLPDATINTAYSSVLSATGGVAPYTWTLASGALPQGLTLNAATGEISGTPVVAQTANFIVTVSDSAGASVTSGTLLLTVRDGTGNSPATVLVTDPAEGATIVGSDVLVNYLLAGTGYNHLHLTVDNNPHITVTSLTGSYLLTNIAPGLHTIKAELVTAQHTVLSNPEATYIVNITTQGVANAPPVAVDDTANVVPSGSIGIPVLTNDSDSDGTLDNTSVSIVSMPANGAVVDNGSGLLTYTHNGSATTSDSFTYTVADNLGAVSNVATVTVLIGTQPIVSNGLVLHLEPDQGLYVVGGTVLNWFDQSAMGNDLQSAGNPQLLNAPDLNSHLVVDFDGVGDKLERTLALNGLPAGNADRTVYMLAKYRGIGFGGFAYGTANCNQAFGAVVDSAGALTAQGWCPANDFVSTTAGTAAGWMTQSIVLQGGVMSHYKDGVAIDTQNHVYDTVLTNLVLGGELADSNFMDMQVAAVLVYNRALSVAELQQVETYLMDKYVATIGGNLSPVAIDDNAAVISFGAVDIPVLSNDSDADGTINSSSVAIVAAPTNGTLIDNGAGVLTYTHNGSATSSDSFSYTVLDDLGAVSNAATVSIVINTQPPVAVDDSAVVAAASSVAIEVLANDSDPDGTLNNTTVSIVVPPSNGTVADDGTGVLTYTHDGTATISDSFTYTVADNLGAVSNVATVTLSIGAQPIVSSGLVLHLEPEQGMVTDAGLVTNWLDQSGRGNDLQSAGDPQLQAAVDLNNHMVVDFDGIGDKLERTLTLHGLPSGNTDRTVYLLAKYRGNGYGGFAYGTASCNQAFGTIVDSAGNLTAQGWCVQEDIQSTTAGTGAGWLLQSIVLQSGQMSHYKDGLLIDSQAHTYDTVLTNLVLGGELADNNFMDMQVAAVLVYNRALSPAERQQQDAYLISKYMNGAAVNLAPVASNDNAALNKSASVAIAVLSNDSDADGALNNTTVTIVAPPANGALVDDGFGVLTYTHNGTATTADSFTYTVMDNLGAVSNIATVTLAINQPPVAVDDNAALNQSSSVAIAVLANDTDSDSVVDNTTVTIVSPPANGLLVNDGAGVLTYTHDGTATTADSFTYTVADDLGAVSNVATVSLSINLAPIAVDDGAAVALGSSVAIPVLSNDSDIDGSLDNTTVTIMTPPVNGTLIDNGSGVLTYTHNGTATTSDSFTYTVADNLGLVSNTATVTLSINQPPVANNDSATVTTAMSVDITVLGNDTDVDGLLDATTVTIVTPATNGSLMVDAAGLVTYTHDGSATTTDSFTYTVADDFGTVSNAATVSISINQPPVAVDDSATADWSSSVVIPVLTNDSDVDGFIDNTTVVIVSAPINGTLLDDGSGLLTYTHDGSATTSDSFTYTVADNQGAISNTATVTIAVNAAVPDGDVAPLGAPDGITNAADILVMTRIVLGEITPTALELQKGDIYPAGAPDGVINLSDLILLQQRVLNMPRF